MQNLLPRVALFATQRARRATEVWEHRLQRLRLRLTVREATLILRITRDRRIRYECQEDPATASGTYLNCWAQLLGTYRKAHETDQQLRHRLYNLTWGKG